MSIANRGKLLTKGIGIDTAIAQYPNFKQSSIALLSLYPPKVCIKYPPEITPKVGAVIQTIEKHINTVFSST